MWRHFSITNHYFRRKLRGSKHETIIPFYYVSACCLQKSTEFIMGLVLVLFLISTFDLHYCRLHSFGLKYRAQEHPESRAIFFDSDKYNKRKVLDLLAALKAFDALAKLMAFVADSIGTEKMSVLDWIGLSCFSFFNELYCDRSL